MEIHGSAIFIPFEYIPFICVGFAVLLIIGAVYVNVRRALAPRKNVEYYNTPSFMRMDD